MLHCSLFDFCVFLGSDMHKKLEEVSRLNHAKYDCLIVCILTHGISGRLYSTDGVLIPVEELTKYFDGVHCPSLVGKPKVRTGSRQSLPSQILSCLLLFLQFGENFGC